MASPAKRLERPTGATRKGAGPGKLKLRRKPLGYWLDGKFRKGFPDDSELPAGQRLRIAGWARALAPDQLTEDQRRLLEGFTPRASEARRRAEAESSYQGSPIWNFLSDAQRKLVDEPSLHSQLQGTRYPLRTAELATLVGVSSDQIRYWNESGLLPARRTEGNQRRFYAEASMWAFLLADMGQPLLSVLRQVREGHGSKFLAALSMLLPADNLQELALSEMQSHDRPVRAISGA